MKLSFSTLACAEWTLEDIFRFAKNCGYDGVELRLHEPHISVAASKKQRQEVKDLAEHYGLEICCLAAYTRFSSADETERTENANNLRSAVELAADLGCPFVRSFGGDPRSGTSVQQTAEWIYDGFKAVENTAETLGVKVLLETHDVLSKGKDVAGVFAHGALPEAGVVWDIKHSLVQGESLTETAEYLEGKIDHIHLKDWIPLHDGREHLVLLGAGLLPTVDIILLLKELRFQGYLSLEWEKLWHPEIEDSAVAIDQYAWYMKRLLAEQMS